MDRYCCDRLGLAALSGDDAFGCVMSDPSSITSVRFDEHDGSKINSELQIGAEDLGPVAG